MSKRGFNKVNLISYLSAEYPTCSTMKKKKNKEEKHTEFEITVDRRESSEKRIRKYREKNKGRFRRKTHKHRKSRGLVPKYRSRA